MVGMRAAAGVRRAGVAGGLVLSVAGCLAAAAEAPLAAGPFAPTLDSLAQYRYPDWFRDAKLGIWAHWGPQSVPMAGDWYARQMYVPGHRQYQHHLQTYGHPSQHGYKDIIALWTAEKWDTERLMGLYKKAGARYFVSMGVHHDNFDLWDSTYQPWNAVRMGPHRDVVGEWQKAARANGLRFGVSEHLGASFTWFQDSHRADKEGPQAGVPYDGADPRYEGLYHWPAAADDKGWYSRDPRWHALWFSRIRDLVDRYQPDLLYTDGGLPFDEVGRKLVAHYYNASAARQGGQVDVVYTCKQESKGMWVQDLERGVMPGIRLEPWQTDTSIGDWFYNKDWKYRGADWVIHMLVDIVAKNGNLLINVVQRPDGSLDPEAEQILAQMAAWIEINGPAIYGTRPWLVHGEGPVKAKGGHFKEDFAYSAKDIRFTAKGDTTLYAFVMGWPAEPKVVIRSLARFPGVTATVANVALLGHAGPLVWHHDAEGLSVELPAARPCDFAVALEITGTDLRGFKPELAIPPSPAIGPDTAGVYTLSAEAADLHGDQVKTEAQGGQPNIGFWDRADEWVSWRVALAAPGTYRVLVSTATVHADAAAVLEVGDWQAAVPVPQTGAWDAFRESEVGRLTVRQAGEQVAKVRARDAQSWKAVNLRWVRLAPVGP